MLVLVNTDCSISLVPQSIINNDELVFSIREEDCKAICFFDVSFHLGGDPPVYNFGFHVPVILEDDGLYYALCWELNQVTYGSRIENAVKRMENLLSDFSNDWMGGENDFSALLENPMNPAYLDLFHKVKHKLDAKAARNLGRFLRSSAISLQSCRYDN